MVQVGSLHVVLFHIPEPVNDAVRTYWTFLTALFHGLDEIIRVQHFALCLPCCVSEAVADVDMASLLSSSARHCCHRHHHHHCPRFSPTVIPSVATALAASPMQSFPSTAALHCSFLYSRFGHPQTLTECFFHYGHWLCVRVKVWLWGSIKWGPVLTFWPRRPRMSL